MIEAVRIWVASGLVVLAALVMAAGIYGMVWMPDVYTRIHAASKAVFLGVFPILGAAMVLGDGVVLSRAILIAAFLLITTPVSSHAIGRAAFLVGEDTATPGAVDESGRE